MGTDHREGKGAVVAFTKKVKGGAEIKKKKLRKDDDAAPAGKVTKFRLPTERSEPSEDIGAYTWLIFGEKKIGKTSLTAQMGEVLHLFTEPGGKALRVYPVVVEDWKGFKKAVSALRNDSRFDTVVVDIVDKLYPAVEDYTCEKLVIDDLADEEWGKGWRANRKEFEKVFGDLLNLGKGVVFISHAQEQEVETRDGEKYDRIMPTMHRRMRDLIEGSVDIWAYYTYDRKRRVLQILGDDHVSAGHRLEGRFLTPDGRPIRRIDMGDSAKQGYRNVVAAFNNKFEPPKESDIDSEEEAPKKKKSKFKVRRS
jgi:hypothetical protein